MRRHSPYEIFITLEPETRSEGRRFEWKSPVSRSSRRAEEKLRKGTYPGIVVVSDRIQVKVEILRTAPPDAKVWVRTFS
jgi:hypothetical protein